MECISYVCLLHNLLTMSSQLHNVIPCNDAWIAQGIHAHWQPCSQKSESAIATNMVQHVVFGELLEGQKILNKIESEAGSSDGEPKVKVLVEDCGEVEHR